MKCFVFEVNLVTVQKKNNIIWVTHRMNFWVTQRIEHLGELHLDGTYRIIIFTFPVNVLGISDIGISFIP